MNMRLVSAVAALVATAFSTSNASMLVRRPVFKNPDVYVLDQSYSEQNWQMRLFADARSGMMTYMADTVGLIHTIALFADASFDRVMFSEDNLLDGQSYMIREYGSRGSGTGEYSVPFAAVVSAPSDDAHFVSYYNVYVADRRNDRVERLRFRWLHPDSGLIHWAYYSHPAAARPVALDLSNAGTYWPDTDDILWVAAMTDRILGFHCATGAVMVNYGSHGSGTGHFSGITGVACGRLATTYANNGYIFIADGGNNRIVRLRWTGTNMQWQLERGFFGADRVVGLTVDNLGHVWAISSTGLVHKFTSDLVPLGSWGAPIAGSDALYEPRSISITPGWMGSGDLIVTEKWGHGHGIRHYSVGIDVLGLSVETQLVDQACISNIEYYLTDYAFVTVDIYDNLGHRIRRVIADDPQPSGAQYETWDGKDSLGTNWGTADFRVVVSAKTLYGDLQTGHPSDSISKDALVEACASACNWRIADCDGNGIYTISDAVYLITYVFGGGPPPVPHPIGSGDADCSSAATISDAVSLINFIFAGQAPPGDLDGVPPPECTCSDYD